ncbi:Uncharacterised protein g6321 [Pycnogonum litorale]
MHASASKTSPDRNKPSYLPTSNDGEKDCENEMLRRNRFPMAFKTKIANCFRRISVKNKFSFLSNFQKRIKRRL